MRAIRATALSPAFDALEVADMPDPRPRRGEVLVRVSAAPVNPSDILQLAGRYVVRREPPFVPGLVGVGRVVETSDAGLLGRRLRDRRVAFAGSDGTWAELAASPATLCVPLPDDLRDEEAVNLLANATTAVALLTELRRARHSAVVITAAGGEVGRMLLSAAGGSGVTALCVVRSDEQAEAVRALGATDVFDQRAPDFIARLREACDAAHCRAAIDAVAGPMLDHLMDALPARSDVWEIGQLSGERASFDVMDQLIGRGHVVRGFNINTWFADQHLLTRLRTARRATRLLLTGHRTQVQHGLSLDQVPDELADAVNSTTGGKTLIYPAGTPSP